MFNSMYSFIREAKLEKLHKKSVELDAFKNLGNY
ncbi:hypothetical protein Halsa_0962 [Halanaerobium hydrogeniformans]|uniref:Uncharacterized protein n=1 Tax=Halanaerobium hydrogeniformans TaxID=656519 RepID=E4RM77_HALHG|nr:hypothetical protein Halsa_0962 [Halanaerobium hydrogeniformans]